MNTAKSHIINETNTRNWVNGIDSLRFVLAIVVFLGHLQNEPAIVLKGQENLFLRIIGVGLNHVYFGPGAVIGFFIISGFVIHYPNKTDDFDWRVFLIRRIIRIGLPLLIVVVFALKVGMFDHIPIWSLYCELIYYSLYPLLRISRISWNRIFIISFVTALCFIWLGATNEVESLLQWKNINYTGSYAALGDMLTWIVGMPCWLLGVLLAERIDQYNVNISTARIFALRVVVLILGVLLVAVKAHGFISFIFTLNFFAFVLVYWLASEILYYRTARSSPAIEYCGKFSYSLYLIHGIVVSFVGGWLTINFVSYFIYILITITVAYFVFLLIEMPSHRLAKYLAFRVAKLT